MDQMGDIRCVRCQAVYVPAGSKPACPECGYRGAVLVPASTPQPGRRPYYPPVNFIGGPILNSIAGIGVARFGHWWRRPMARDLDISDRLVRMWERGESTCGPDYLQWALISAARHRDVIDARIKDGQEVLRRTRWPFGAPRSLA
jgi:hypothetical protein